MKLQAPHDIKIHGKPFIKNGAECEIVRTSTYLVYVQFAGHEKEGLFPVSREFLK